MTNIELVDHLTLSAKLFCWWIPSSSMSCAYVGLNVTGMFATHFSHAHRSFLAWSIAVDSPHIGAASTTNFLNYNKEHHEFCPFQALNSSPSSWEQIHCLLHSTHGLPMAAASTICRRCFGLQSHWQRYYPSTGHMWTCTELLSPWGQQIRSDWFCTFPCGMKGRLGIVDITHLAFPIDSSKDNTSTPS